MPSGYLTHQDYFLWFYFFLPSISFLDQAAYSKIINSKITENFTYLSEDLSEKQ